MNPLIIFLGSGLLIINKGKKKDALAPAKNFWFSEAYLIFNEIAELNVRYGKKKRE